MTSHRDKPSLMELRVIEREGRRWLQQYRLKPGAMAYEYDWVDVCELPRPLAAVRKLRP